MLTNNPMKSSFKALLKAATPVTRALLTLRRLIERLVSAARAQAIFSNPTVVCHRSTEIKFPQNITLGDHVVIGSECTLGATAPIYLGDHVRLSKGVMLETAGLDFGKPPPYRHISKPIRLEAGVWVGARAIVLGGVTVGEGAVIGAGAVVSRDVAAGAIIVGQPSRTKFRA